jgi:hypothetical protein
VTFCNQRSSDGVVSLASCEIMSFHLSPPYRLLVHTCSSALSAVANQVLRCMRIPFSGGLGSLCSRECLCEEIRVPLCCCGDAVRLDSGTPGESSGGFTVSSAIHVPLQLRFVFSVCGFFSLSLLGAANLSVEVPKCCISKPCTYAELFRRTFVFMWLISGPFAVFLYFIIRLRVTCFSGV